MDLTLDTGARKVSGDAVSYSRDLIGNLKLSRKEILRVRLLSNGSSFSLGVGDTLQLVLKPYNLYEGTVLQLVSLSSTDLSNGLYVKEFSTYTDPVLDLLAVDADSTSNIPSEVIMAALVYTPSGEEPEEAGEFYIRLRNAVLQDGDLTPDDVDSRETWLSARAVRYDIAQALTSGQKTQARTNISAAAISDISPNPGYWTALTGGAATALDGIATASGATSTSHVIITAIGGVLRHWQLQVDPAPGVTAENAAGGIVLPDDYNAATNARIWVEIA
jgi:hypothetical protein